MVTSADCIKKYGFPEAATGSMVMYDTPDKFTDKIPCLPNRIYCNKDLIKPLEAALNNVADRQLHGLLKTWDGCFNIRKKRGGSSFSLHSWGIAIDINAAENPFKATPKMDARLVKCFKDAGFDWGGDWTNATDGMHFQLKKI